MTGRATRYALVAVVVLACRGAGESSEADTTAGSMDSTSMVAAVSRDSGSSAGQAPSGNPSLGPTDTVPVRKAPPSAPSIVDTATLPTIQKIVAHHPQTVDSTIMVFNEELRRLGRRPSAQWTALHDSVRKDLEKLAVTGEGSLVAVFREHYARFTRFRDTHRALVG